MVMKSHGELIDNKYQIINSFPFVIGVLYYTEVQHKEKGKQTCFIHGLDLKRFEPRSEQVDWIEKLYNRKETVFFPLEEVFIEEDILYQVYKRLEGYLLVHYIKKHFPIDVKNVLRMAQQVVDHLLQLYEEDQFAIVHPQNIIVSRNEKLRFLYGGPAQNLPKGMVFTQQSKEVDQLYDSYGLGALLYQMLTGKSPMSNGLKIPPLHQFLSNCPPKLDDLVMRSLSFDVEKRPTIAEFDKSFKQLVSFA